MKNIPIQRIKTISQYHRYRGLPQPEHPLISLVNFEEMKYSNDGNVTKWCLDFYSVALKRTCNGKLRYGQQHCDFDAGVMFCMAPGQIFSIEEEKGKEFKTTGWMLLFHPDFLWGSSLVPNIKKYGYFEYESNEALFLSEKEESSIVTMLQSIKQEYQSNIDQFSQELIIAQLELLLKFTNRYYNRQFLTRVKTNHQILVRLEKVLEIHFEDLFLSSNGVPSVASIAQELNFSPNYLSALLKVKTGQTTQQHIHNKLIEKAKEKLSSTDLSVSEIAFQLGFEHLASFTKLFRTKTHLNPSEFRQSFN